MRVLIGTPTFEYHRHCVTEFMAALAAQSERCFDLILVDNSPTEEFADELRAAGLPVFRSPFHPLMRRRTAHARNLIRELLLRGDYTHLLFLDQDVILPPRGLARLLGHGLPVVSGIYCKHIDREPYAMVVLPDWRSRVDGVRVTPWARLRGRQELVEIEGAGFGCLLVEREACMQVAFRYQAGIGADLTFCEDLNHLGYQLYCDPGILCEHRYVERDFERHTQWGRW